MEKISPKMIGDDVRLNPVEGTVSWLLGDEGSIVQYMNHGPSLRYYRPCDEMFAVAPVWVSFRTHHGAAL